MKSSSSLESSLTTTTNNSYSLPQDVDDDWSDSDDDNNLSVPNNTGSISITISKDGSCDPSKEPATFPEISEGDKLNPFYIAKVNAV